MTNLFSGVAWKSLLTFGIRVFQIMVGIYVLRKA